MAVTDLCEGLVPVDQIPIGVARCMACYKRRLKRRAVHSAQIPELLAVMGRRIINKNVLKTIESNPRLQRVRERGSC